jgi:ATP-binding protein involved in chromosome partitioning
MASFWNRNKQPATPKTPAAEPHSHEHGHSHSHGHDHHGHSHSHAPAAQAQTPAAKASPTAGSAGPAALAGVRNVIAIASGKGGVGKSTVTTNLAVALRYMGSSVGLLDADLYGPSQPGMLGAKGQQGKTTPEGALIPTERNGLKFLSMGLFMPGDGPLVWRAPMAMKAITQFLTGTEWGALDYLLIDLPPGTGDVQLTLAQQARLAGAVIVTTPQEVSLGIAKKGLEMFRNLNIPILGIVENMSGFTCKHCNHETAIFKEGGGEKLARTLGVPFLGALPLDPEIMMSGDEGVPVLDKGTDSHAAKAIMAVANRLDQETRASSQSLNAQEPKSFALASPQSLMIEWPDGHASIYRPYTMRVNCGCANCVDENTGRPTLDPKRVPLDIAFQNVQAVGRYALTASFSDGHSTGIYPFKKLRAICECSSCVRPREASQPSFSV